MDLLKSGQNDCVENNYNTNIKPRIKKYYQLNKDKIKQYYQLNKQKILNNYNKEKQEFGTFKNSYYIIVMVKKIFYRHLFTFKT